MSLRLAKALLATATVGILLAVVATFGWWTSRGRGPVSLERLSVADRQLLFDQMREAQPGVYEPAWFQPDIGYTLRPSSEITVWGDTFQSNEFGYRTGPPQKRPSTYRILVVGDSWAYGMGVKESESYPQVLARLVAEHAGIDKRVYVALWSENFVHALMSEGGLQSSYAVVPGYLTMGDWDNPPPWGHGTAAANERYAQLLYRLLAQRLQWPDLPSGIVHPEIAEVSLYTQPPRDGAWRVEARSELERESRRVIPGRFRAGPDAAPQWAGPGNPSTGMIGRGTTILVRPPEGTSTLRIEVERLEEVQGLYPIVATARIPSASDPTEARMTVPWDGEGPLALDLPVPKDLREGSVLDVKLEVSSMAALGHSRIPGSLRIVSVEPVQEPRRSEG